MVKTKQTARKESGSTKKRAKFPAATPQSKDLPSSSSRTEDTEPREDTKPRADTEGSETGLGEVEPREVKPAASTNQQPHTQIVLSRHTSVSGMDPSFIRYYREHGMTSFLMENLMTTSEGGHWR